MNNSTVYLNDRIVGVIGGLVVVVLVLAMVIRLILYVFRAMSLYRIAKNRAIRGAWLTWVPVANAWIQGSISDQYQYVVKGRIKHNRLILLLLSVMTTLVSLVTVAVSTGVLAATVAQMLFDVGRVSYSQVTATMVASAVQSIVSLVWLVFHYLTLNDLYISCTKRHHVLFLVLNVFFKWVEPFFLFVCRNMEEGMPPRRTAQVCAQAHETPEQEAPAVEVVEQEEVEQETVEQIDI